MIPAACPTCGFARAESDRFCEACGEAFATDPGAGERRVVDAVGVGGVSDVGLVRARNEDAFVVEVTGLGVVGVVCDGVASSADGWAAADRGSSVAATALAEAMARPDEWEPGGAMRAALARAGAVVAALGTDGATGGRSPSCTLVAATWDGAHVSVASVGDSRAYWLAPGASRQLTVDDSWVQEQVSAGAMSEGTAMTRAQAHAITNWLGADAPGTAHRVLTFVPPGRGHVVLCSDGLWNHVPEPERLEALVATDGVATPGALAARLADAALEAGGRDNVTVVVMEVQP